MKKKQSFLLAELMLAFFLLSCILFPMMKSHISIMRKEYERIDFIQLDRQKESCFAYIRQKLYENAIPFSDLKKGTQGTLPEPLLLCKGHKYNAHYTIKPLESCQRKQSFHENFLLIEVKLTMLAQNKKKGPEYITTFLVREYA